MAGANPHPMALLARERQRAMGGHRFQPENYHEIIRVLGQKFAPAEINRVVSKHRADAASAYLRRLHRDVNKAQKGFYQNMSVSPLQIKRLSIKKEDRRNFKSLLVPKLSPLEDPNPSPRSQDTTYPQEVPPMVVQNGSNYVPHKFFSPHTHIHVLYKQNPGIVSPRRPGANSSVGSVASGESSPSGISSKTPRLAKPLTKLAATKLSPRKETGALSKSPEESDPEWPQEHHALPYSYPKFAVSHPPLPNIKKRVSVDKGSMKSESRNVTMTGAPKGWADVNSSQPLGKGDGGLPVSVAAALAAGNPTDALYRLDLPADLAASYDKNLPSERPKAVVVGNRGRLPPPSFPTSIKTSELLAIVSVEKSNAVQVAA